MDIREFYNRKKAEFFEQRKKNLISQTTAKQDKIKILEEDLKVKSELASATQREADLKAKISKVTPESNFKKFVRGVSERMKANQAKDRRPSVFSNPQNIETLKINKSVPKKKSIFER